MTAHRYAWIDAMLREWVSDCGDLELLRSWQQTIAVRLREVERNAELSIQQLADALNTAKPGDALFAGKRLRIPWNGPVEALHSVVYLVTWDRDTRRALVATKPGGDTRREIDASEISFYQLATKRLHVRRYETMRQLKRDSDDTTTKEQTT
jgi:hypothetical protein